MKIQPGAAIAGKLQTSKIARSAAISSGYAGDRIVELGTEPLLDLRADLSAQAQDESSAAQQLMIIGLVRQVYRVAGERNRDIRHETQAAHRGGQR